MMKNDRPLASRRGLLTAALAGSVAGSGTFAARAELAAPTPPDPVFVLIERSRALEARFAVVVDVLDKADSDAGTSPDWRAANDASEARFATC